MIYVASDHGGFALKRRIVRFLIDRGYTVTDVGPARRRATDDYPTWAAQVAKRVQRRPGSRGILACRSGVGMAVVANKFSGIRAVQGLTRVMAQRSRQDEDTNVLSLAADYQSWPVIRGVIDAWLKTPYRPTVRFQRRLKEIKRLEHHGS